MKNAISLILLAGCLWAQQNGAQKPPVIVSPQVQTDGRVTFRYYEPDAHNVTVHLEGFRDALSMQKDSAGIWSVTTNVLQPEIYGYSFEADGMQRLDPMNSQIKPNLLGVTNLVEVPGPSSMPWDQADIPHGSVHHHFYRSVVIGDERDFYVYTPPGYDPKSDKRYPVLYLLHGFSDDASGWTAVGKANLILDTLIDSEKAVPMIVVMPLGYGVPSIVSRAPRSATANWSSLRAENFNKFQLALVQEVIPSVERMYLVDSSRDQRAIAGLSMGGAESLLTGLNHLAQFSWVGAFSAGGLSQELASDFPGLSSNDNSKLHLLWIACGTEDRLIAPNRELEAWLDQKGIKFTKVETPGMHTWMVWREDLVHFAPLLFRSPESSANAK